jgi:hypothetical protein
VLAPHVLCLDLIWSLLPLRLKILNTNFIILLATLFYPLHVKHVSLLRVSFFHATKENTELQQEVAYLTACLEKTIFSKKIIEEDLSQVEESATKSTYKLGVEFESCEKKGEKSATKFVPSSSYHKEEKPLKPIKAYYLSNPKSLFNLKRGVKRESPKSREEAFVYILCGRASHMDAFYFQRKRIERRHIEYARNSYRDEFINFPPHSYSHAPSHFYSRASPHTSSHVFPQFSYGPNHHSYGFGS